MLPVWLTDTVTPDLDRAIRYTHLWGLEGLVLRTLGRFADRVPYVNEEKLLRRIRTHELPIVAIMPGMFEGDVTDRITWMNELASFEETLSFCRRIGCGRVLVSAFQPGAETAPVAEVLRRAGEMAARHGLTLGVCNEWGGAFPTAKDMRTLLAAVNHPAVAAAWSPADALRADEPPLTGLQELEDRLTLVRCFDGVGRGEEWHPNSLGEGEVDWPNVIRSLHSAGFEGPICLEVTTSPAAKAGLRDATALLRMLRDAERAG